jgi:phosphoribosylformylglycinamidine synthase
VRDHLRSDPKRTSPHPTRTELGVFAQTWSEHCKHKEFNAEIRFRGASGEVTTVRSLFKTFIQGSTEQIREVYAAAGTDFLVTVFKDNAGVVKLDDDQLLVLKVETHNSPSALDPLGGAMTGVLGVNRDAFGTGKGGAKLLFNTDVLCFGPPDYARPLLAGQLHPRRVFEGVREGVEQAGNQTGVPTVNGALVFDDRFAGKPLVFCGTAALMPVWYRLTPSHLKELQPGDRVVMAGGRVGQDGLGGATFSSAELTNAATRSVVQIGSPITQKGLSDFVEEACALGLVSGCTDNGAGGLSSSVGELAQETGGAAIDLSLVPLKVPGLQPWEIFLSESQERMTLAVRPAQLAGLRALARARHVEVSDLGEFTASGRLDVRHGQITVASLDLHFLHHGVPKKVMEAEWSPPPAAEPALVEGDLGADLLALLGSHNICSREKVVRQFDHEVKGRSVLKSYMGPRGKAPQDAAVLRVGLDGDLGLAVASGICPKYGDLDPYEMSAGAFDEALRSLISVGVPLPRPGTSTVISACDNFCVPDSAYDAVGNPDGKEKLGKLVRMCQALYDSATFFLVPMTSGKDSMKNDFRVGGVKISVPPTVLYTMVARLDDVTRAVSAEFKQAGDAVLRVGHTHDELGASEHYRLKGALGAHVPRVRPHDARRVYQKMTELHALGLLRSSHDLSDGGLAVALAECALGAHLGARIDLPGGGLSARAELFSESHSRFVVTVSQENLARALDVLGPDGALLGEVTAEPVLRVKCDAQVLSLPVAQLAQAYEGGT